jgi:hypothetical protein
VRRSSLTLLSRIPLRPNLLLPSPLVGEGPGGEGADFSLANQAASRTAPKTSWGFTTLVYDKDATGDAWDKIIPLGAMWGNDPMINSAVDPNALLSAQPVGGIRPTVFHLVIECSRCEHGIMVS